MSWLSCDIILVKVEEQQTRLWHLDTTHPLQQNPRGSWLTRCMIMDRLEEHQPRLWLLVHKNISSTNTKGLLSQAWYDHEEVGRSAATSPSFGSLGSTLCWLYEIETHEVSHTTGVP